MSVKFTYYSVSNKNSQIKYKVFRIFFKPQTFSSYKNDQNFTAFLFKRKLVPF